MVKPKILGQLKKQPCAFCGKKTLTLTEGEIDVPYFGKCSLFSMNCDSCKYHKEDIESQQLQEPAKYTFEINGEEDLKVRVVKSSEATVKLPHIITIQPGPASNGYITNIEGILNRVKDTLESQKEAEDDKDAKKKLMKLIKKVNRVLWGKEKLKITIEDPSGNSAIISDKAIRKKIK